MLHQMHQRHDALDPGSHQHKDAEQALAPAFLRRPLVGALQDERITDFCSSGSLERMLEALETFLAVSAERRLGLIMPHLQLGELWISPALELQQR